MKTSTVVSSPIPKAPPPPPPRPVATTPASATPQQTPLSAAHGEGLAKGGSMKAQLQSAYQQRTLRAANNNDPSSTVKNEPPSSTDGKKSKWSMPSGEALAAISGATTAAGGLGTVVAGQIAQQAANVNQIVEMQNVLHNQQMKMGAAAQSRSAELINTLQTVK